MSSGLNAVASRYTDIAITKSTVLICSSNQWWGRAGAMIVETIMRLKPVKKRMRVAVQFRRAGQSCGFEGSVGELKMTR